MLPEPIWLEKCPDGKFYRRIGDGAWTNITKEQAVAEFEAIAQTTPERAAEIIHRGVKAGRSRILVGGDAYLFETLARLAPTRYYDVLERVARIAERQAQRSIT